MGWTIMKLTIPLVIAGLVVGNRGRKCFRMPMS